MISHRVLLLRLHVFPIPPFRFSFFLFSFCSINKPGGCAKIVKVHTNRAYDNLADDETSFIEGLDVKYVLVGGGEKNLDPAIVAPYEMLERGGRSRRGRDFLMKQEEDIVDTQTNRGRRRGRDKVTKEPSGIADANASQSAQRNKKPAQPIVAPPGKENKNRKQKYNSSGRSGATCSSPEPPRVQKRLPKQVSPIPKVIRINTGKEKDDVSPMSMDAMGASYSSSPSSYSTNTNKRTQLDFDEKMPISTTGLPPLPNDLVAPKRSISTLQSKGMSHKNNSLPYATTTSSKHDKKRKRARLSEGHDKIISSSKKQSCGKDSRTATKYNHSKPRLSSHPHASFSRATSAYSTIQKANCKTTESISKIQPTKKKPLLEVYRSEVEKARKFMDEMVGLKDCRNDNANEHDCKSDKQKASLSSLPAKA